MTTIQESLPTSWTAADDHFFRVTKDLFPQEFLAGAGVLLASYDDEFARADSPPQSCGQPHPSTTEQAGTMVAEVSGPS
jgi:hypothetical protein